MRSKALWFAINSTPLACLLEFEHEIIIVIKRFSNTNNYYPSTVG